MLPRLKDIPQLDPLVSAYLEKLKKRNILKVI